MEKFILKLLRFHILFPGVFIFYSIHCSAISPSYNNPMDGANGFIANLLLSTSTSLVSNTLSIGNPPTFIEEGASHTMTVKLSVKSTSEITVNITSECGCFDFNGSTTGTLLFTPNESTIEQNLIITALIDSNTTSEKSKITFTSSNVETSTLTIENRETGASYVQFSTPNLFSTGDTIKISLKGKPYGKYEFEAGGIAYNGITIVSPFYSFTPEDYNIGKDFIVVTNISSFLLDKNIITNYRRMTVGVRDNGGAFLQSLSLEINKFFQNTSDGDFRDNLDGTVTDTRNNLRWQKCTSDQTQSTCTGSRNLYIFESAYSSCESLSLGNSTNWRLPTRAEIFTILNQSNSPKIQTIFKNHTESGNYWTMYSDSATTVWTGSFANGVFVNQGKTIGAYARCITNEPF
jgi:hypothetical protein